tara:strand:- start:1083 stop:2270 length:1188 start_codon:yes stop_codon:yes gene_type:complete
MKPVNTLSFEKKVVLLRVDFNVPLNSDFKILDDTRILSALPTIKKILNKKNKLIIMSHLGRPNGRFEEKFSLTHLVKHLSNLLKKNVLFSPNCIGKPVLDRIKNMSYGDVLLLENLRFHAEEKSGNEAFAKELSKLADIYVNDAFGVCHRSHASTTVVAKYFKEKFSGELLENEVAALEKALKKPKKPLTAIIGGAKIKGKVDVISSLLDRVDNLIIGGGMAYTFIKAKGGNIGNSLCEKEKIPIASDLIKQAKEKGVSLFLPVDSVNAESFNNNAKREVTDIYNISNLFMGLDIGEKTISSFSKIILTSKTIIWNGPMGVFEMSNFQNGTLKILEAIVLATKKGAFSVVGGGDSVSAIKKFDYSEGVSYISTGGGAMLEYLEGKRLPGIIALEN